MPDDLQLPLANRQVAVVAVAVGSYHLRLHFWAEPPRGEGDYVLEVEGTALLRDSHGQETAIEPRAGPYPPVVELVGQTVLSAIARSSGRLELLLSGGTALTIPEAAFEPWQLRRDGGEYMVVSVAGGGIAVWD
jgi:hypothetical protein